MAQLDRQTVTHLREDIGAFAEHLVGQPLWPHQLELATDPARIRTACCGRQAGKSRTLQVLALHQAFATPGSRVLVISAGEVAANDLLADAAVLTSAPLLSGSVVDTTTSTITLSNGSTIRSVPASQKQVRGRSIDLLILDEAALIDDSIWRASQYTVIARPESRVVMTGTPWGREDRFFATAYRAGVRGESGYSAHHWPSSASPLVDETLLAMFRQTSTDRAYRAEVLAEWVGDSGAFFEMAELETAVALGGEDGAPLVDPASAVWASTGRLPLVVGADWGMSGDASTLVGVGPVPDELPFAAPGRLWVALVVEKFGVLFHDFIEDAVRMGGHRDGIRFERIFSERNGIGEMPSQQLRRRAVETRVCSAAESVTTTSVSKANNYGALKVLFQQQGLVLPRHVELLRQLSNLEFETLESGTMRISVPESRGHDDLAMALSLAMSGSVEDAQRWSGARRGSYRYQRRALRGTR